MRGEPKPFNMIWLVLAALVAVVIVFDVAYGSGTDIEQTTGDVTVGGDSSKAFAVGRSSFDVDIAQCMGSVAWDTILGGKQKLVINWVCLTEFYLNAELYDLAAMAICNTEVLTEFDDEAACEAAHDFKSIATAIEPALIYEDEVSHEEDIEVVQMAQVGLESRIEALEKKPAPRPQVVQKAAPAYSDEQYNAIFSILKGDEDE